MHEFRYKHNELYCEDAVVRDLAIKYNTPLYVYSKRTLLDHFHKIKDAFRSIEPLICYSVKANSNLSICRLLVEHGAGLDVVSGGEFYIGLRAGVSPKKVVYAGVGKKEDEIEFAIKKGILLFNVESLQELVLIDEICRRLKKTQSVAIRINPDVRPKTHGYITTGHEESKFGVDMKTAMDIFMNRSNFNNLDICGIHIHIGSQIVDAKPFVRAIAKIVNFVKVLEEKGIEIEWLNIGGGLGIIYSGEKPQTAKEYAKEVLPLLKGLDLKVILEPGRFIIGNSGILLTKVVYIKETRRKNFAIVDAGMNDLIRPSLYGAYHEVLPLRSMPYSALRQIPKYDIVGPICESGDFIAKERRFISIEQGDFLAIMGAGAYGFSMSSNYNSRTKPAEVMVDGKRHRLIRRREAYRDLIRGQV